MLKSAPVLVRVAVVVSLVAVVAVFIRGLLSFYFCGGRFFWLESPSAKIEKIDTTAGDTTTPVLLQEYLGLSTGKPLFPRKEGVFSNAFRNRQRAVLNLAHTLATLTVSRRFDGSIEILSTERVPLVRVSGTGFAIDREGVVFICRKGLDQLVGLDGIPVVQLSPGRIVADGKTITAALRLVSCLADGNVSIKISSIKTIDVSSGDYVLIKFKDGRTAKLAWQNMTAPSEVIGRIYLEAQLEGLSGTMQDRRSRGMTRFDCTVKGRCFGSE